MVHALNGAAPPESSREDWLTIPVPAQPQEEKGA